MIDLIPASVLTSIIGNNISSTVTHSSSQGIDEDVRGSPNTKSQEDGCSLSVSVSQEDIPVSYEDRAIPTITDGSNLSVSVSH